MLIEYTSADKYVLQIWLITIFAGSLLAVYFLYRFTDFPLFIDSFTGYLHWSFYAFIMSAVFTSPLLLVFYPLKKRTFLNIEPIFGKIIFLLLAAAFIYFYASFIMLGEIYSLLKVSVSGSIFYGYFLALFIAIIVYKWTKSENAPQPPHA